MRIQTYRRPRTEGSALGVTLVATGIIGAALATYLSLTGGQNQMTLRSQAWNGCIPVAEAGIEEAMAHLNANGTNLLATQGWQLQNGLYWKSNQVGAGYYVVSISQSQPRTILSAGHHPFAGTGTLLSRTLKVTARELGVFMGSIIAKSSITLNGNNTLIDSFDSSDPAKSTGGQYDATKAGDAADVAFMGSLASLAIGNGNIWGKMFTSPTGGFTTGPNGALGSESWNQGGNTGVQPGWHSSDLNYTFVDVTKPFVAGVPPTPGTVNGTYYSYILGNGDYETPTLGSKVLVAGHAVLYVGGNIKFTGPDRIDIQPGASLKIYAAGANAEFNTINNANNSAGSFQYYGLPTNTKVDLNGTLLHGAVYAPQANVKVSGNSVIYASLVANNVTINGNAAIHYDEALLNQGMSQGFFVDSWDEL